MKFKQCSKNAENTMISFPFFNHEFVSWQRGCLHTFYHEILSQTKRTDLNLIYVWLYVFCKNSLRRGTRWWWCCRIHNTSVSASNTYRSIASMYIAVGYYKADILNTCQSYSMLHINSMLRLKKTFLSQSFYSYVRSLHLQIYLVSHWGATITNLNFRYGPGLMKIVWF